MFSIKKYFSVMGYLSYTPKFDLLTVHDLVTRAKNGSEEAAFNLYRIATSTAPAYTAPVNASKSIGSGDNGVVTVTANQAWEAGNDLTLQVAINAGANASLSATFVGNDILVTLGTGSSAGVVDPTKNTAILVAGAINAISGRIFTAIKSGTGATAIPGIVAKANFTGGVDEVLTEGRKAWNVASVLVQTLFE
jgi:hypothetical protein